MILLLSKKDSKRNLSKNTTIDKNRTFGLIRKGKIGFKSIEIKIISKTFLHLNIANESRFKFAISKFKLILKLLDNMIIAIKYIFILIPFQFITIPLHYSIFIKYLISFTKLITKITFHNLNHPLLIFNYDLMF